MKSLLYITLILACSVKAFSQTEAPTKTWTLAKSNSPQKPFTYTPSGFLMVADGNNIRMLNTQSNQDVVLKGHDKDVHLLRLSIGSKLLLSASTDNDVKLWDLTTFKEIPMRDEGKKEKKSNKVWNVVVQGAKYLPNGKVKEGVYDAANAKNKVEDVSDMLRPKDRKFNPLKAAGFNNDGYNLTYFVCDADRAFEIIGWELYHTDFWNVMTLPKSSNPDDPMLFSASGRFLAYGYSESATTKIWDIIPFREINSQIRNEPFDVR
jgi:WD40 repeat protein